MWVLSERVLLGILSDKVLLRILSDSNIHSILSDRVFPRVPSGGVPIRILSYKVLLNNQNMSKLKEKNSLLWKYTFRVNRLRRPLLNVAQVVNIKLTITDWFFYNFIILIKYCKMRYLNLDKTWKFRQKLKTLTSSNCNRAE